MPDAVITPLPQTPSPPKKMPAEVQLEPAAFAEKELPEPAPEDKPATPSVDEPDKTEDKSWNRLQAIMQRHREQTEPAEDSTESTGGNTAVNAASSPLPHPANKPQPQQTQGTETAVPQQPASVSKQPAPRQSPVQRSLAEGAAPSPAGSEEQTKAPQTTLTPQPPSPPATGAIVQRQSQPAAAVQPQPPLAGEADDYTSGLSEKTDVVTGETAVSPSNEIDTPQAQVPPQPEQSLPLEAVWPVQAAQTVQRSSEMNTLPDQQPPAAPPTTRAAAQPDAEKKQTSESSRQPVSEIKQAAPSPPSTEAAHIQRTLENVISGQPTASSIEWVPPRRPRPGKAAAAPISGEQTGASRIYPKATEGSAQNLPAQTVATEIGPLPADLWHMLGETPPMPPPHQEEPHDEAAHTVSKTPAAPTSNVAQAAKSEASIQQPEIRQTMPSDDVHRFPDLSIPNVSDAVGAVGDDLRSRAKNRLHAAGDDLRSQATDRVTAVGQTLRSGAGDKVSSARSALANALPGSQLGRLTEGPADLPDLLTPGETGSESSAGTDEKNEPLDIDELANQVYRDLKRRLSIEWERARGRI